VPLTRNEQIAEAVQHLKPARDRRDECRADVEGLLDVMDTAIIAHEVFAADRSAAASKARRAYNTAARKLLAADKALRAAGWQGPIDPALIEHVIAKSEPTPWKKWELLTNQGWRRLKGPPRVVFKQGRAVAFAYELVAKWCGPDKLGHTKRGTWWHVARILLGKRLGERGSDLFRQMLAFQPRYYCPLLPKIHTTQNL
jgi:hypothetical protein